jgi:hypothetical protein
MGHMEYLLAGKKKCKFLYIGITNPDPSHIKKNKNDLNRSEIKNNPFTYRERYCMIRDSMIEADIPQNQFAIVPFPIENPELIQYYTPKNAKYYITIYDDR